MAGEGRVSKLAADLELVGKPTSSFPEPHQPLPSLLVSQH